MSSANPNLPLGFKHERQQQRRRSSCYCPFYCRLKPRFRRQLTSTIFFPSFWPVSRGQICGFGSATTYWKQKRERLLSISLSLSLSLSLPSFSVEIAAIRAHNLKCPSTVRNGSSFCDERVRQWIICGLATFKTATSVRSHRLIWTAAASHGGGGGGGRALNLSKWTIAQLVS
jgi:hypothetical protein